MKNKRIIVKYAKTCSFFFIANESTFSIKIQSNSLKYNIRYKNFHVSYNSYARL